MTSKFEEIKNLSVLYAEDDPTLREISQQTLKLIVKNVYAVSDGEEALRVYAEKNVDVIILDIYMGQTSGIEVAKKIRQSNDKIPIVIVSGSIATADLLEACKLNLIEYIHKPIAFNVLIKVLYSAVDRLRAQGMLVANISESLAYDYFAKVLLHQNGETIALSKGEIEVLELLLANRSQVVSYERFLHVVDEELSDGALKNLILRLRKKLGGEAEIKNLSKIGYKLV